MFVRLRRDKPLAECTRPVRRTGRDAPADAPVVLEAPPDLRAALIGGGPVPADLIDRAEAVGVPVISAISAKLHPSSTKSSQRASRSRSA